MVELQKVEFEEGNFDESDSDSDGEAEPEKPQLQKKHIVIQRHSIIEAHTKKVK